MQGATRSGSVHVFGQERTLTPKWRVIGDKDCEHIKEEGYTDSGSGVQRTAKVAVMDSCPLRLATEHPGDWFRVIPLIYLVVIAVTLSYYSFFQKEYLLIVGLFLNFIVANLIATLYFSYGILLFSWSQPLMAVITDRIAIFGRILMVLNLPTKRT